MIKKIAFIGGRDIHSLGGIENYMLNLSQMLVKRGYEIVVYCESDHNGVSFENGVKIISWRTFHWNIIDKPIFGLLSTLHALFIERKVDLFHYNAWPPSLSSWLPALFRKKSLMQGHGLEWQRTKYSPRQRKIMKFMEKLTAHMNKNLLMVSQDQTNFFQSEYGRTCVTIPPGVPIPKQIPSESIQNTLRKFGLKKGCFFLYLGRLVQDKNPDVLIRAFLKHKYCQDAKLVMAGSNPANPAYVEELKRLGRANRNIIFTGAVYGDEKEALLSQALAYCIPSTLEGLPISLLEAMSYGKFCIASDIPGCREALGKNGDFLPLENLEDELTLKMDHTFQNMKSAEEKGKKNEERIREFFTWDIVTEKYIAFIMHL